jgi:hypothetical protein
MILHASRVLFTLDEKNAKLIKNSKDLYKSKRKEGMYNLSYNNVTSFQIFLIGQCSFLSRCFTNGKKKRKIIEKTEKLIHQ